MNDDNRKSGPTGCFASSPRMVRDVRNIPVSPTKAVRVTSAITFTPLVGWDVNACRLGYDDGYFDRTLAALAPRPLTIGLGFRAAQLPTVFPQPHDIPLDFIVTEVGIQVSPEAP